MHFVVGSKDSRFGSELKSRVPDNLNCGYFMKKVFRVPFIGEFTYWGDGRNCTPEKLGIKPIGYIFSFTFKKCNNLFGKDFYKLESRSEKTQYKERIHKLINLHSSPQITMDINNYLEVSENLAALENNLSDLENKFIQYQSLKEFQKAILDGGREVWCGCEACCDSSWYDLSSDYIKKNSVGIGGFKRLTLYSALSGNSIEKKEL